MEDARGQDGVRLGPSQSLFNMVSQSAAPMRQVGVATSTGMFLRQCGGMIGVSIFGALLTSKLSESLSHLVPGGKVDLGQMERFAMTARTNGGGGFSIPPQVAQAFSDSMSFIFAGSLFILAAALVAIFFIPQITLPGRGPRQDLEKAGEGVNTIDSAITAAANPVRPWRRRPRAFPRPDRSHRTLRRSPPRPIDLRSHWLRLAEN